MKRIIILLSIFAFSAVNSASCAQRHNPVLALTIKSDKVAYQLGEEIKVHFEFKNLSDKPVEFDDSYISLPAESFFISNEFGEKFDQLIILGEGHSSGQLASGEAVNVGWRNLDMIEDKPGVIALDQEGNTYRLIGKHFVYAKRNNIVSNTIEIEIVK